MTSYQIILFYEGKAIVNQEFEKKMKLVRFVIRNMAQ